MDEKIIKFLNKAEKNIHLAKKLFNDNELEVSISRLYYAMFYITQALLLSNNQSFSSHKGVIINFGNLFVKSGIFDKKYHYALKEAFEDRQEADYDFVEFDKKKIEEYLKISSEFLEEAKKYLSER